MHQDYSIIAWSWEMMTLGASSKLDSEIPFEYSATMWSELSSSSLHKKNFLTGSKIQSKVIEIRKGGIFGGVMNTYNGKFFMKFKVLENAKWKFSWRIGVKEVVKKPDIMVTEISI
ncbi:hypothetical protein AHAS_Ahas12G0252700 [Arachis hypogaea]